MEQESSLAIELKGEYNHEEHHVTVGEYLKSLVYGGLDGLVNTLSVIVGGFGSGATTHNIMAVGVSVMVGDGIGMALGDYLSSKSQAEFLKNERDRETWEVENALEDQKRQLRCIYEKNYAKQDATRVVDLIAQNKEAFVNIMMMQELGLAPEEGSPIANGFVTLIAFMLFGLFPLLPYIIESGNDPNHLDLLIVAIAVGAASLFALGFAKAWLIQSNRLLSGTTTLFFGSLCVAVGYGVGLGLNPGEVSHL